MMHGHFNKLFEGVEVGMENKGEKLLITLTGTKEKVAVIEKKLNAMKELCSCGDDCKGGDDCHCGSC
jgi:hypothetical protein